MLVYLKLKVTGVCYNAGSPESNDSSRSSSSSPGLCCVLLLQLASAANDTENISSALYRGFS